MTFSAEGHDASSDGTSEAIADQFPEVTVLYGDGQLY